MKIKKKHALSVSAHLKLIKNLSDTTHHTLFTWGGQKWMRFKVRVAGASEGIYSHVDVALNISDEIV